ERATADLREGPTCGRAFRLIGESEDGYLVLAAWALVLASSGTTPSCCIRPRASQLTKPSANLPFSRRAMVTPEMLICLPVGAIPRRSPLWVPRQDQRVSQDASRARGLWTGTAEVWGVQSCTSDSRVGPARTEENEPRTYCPLGARCGA